MKKFVSFFLLVGMYALCQGQTLFHLSFENAVYSPVNDTMTIDIMLSLNSGGVLGSSNLVFTYDTSALQLISLTPSGLNPIYTLQMTSSLPGQSSYNLTLATPGTGDSIPAMPQERTLATLAWMVKDESGDLSIDWYEDGTRGTVVFLGDETSQLAAGDLINYSPLGGSFPIEWGGFTVVKWGERARLRWTTAREVNNVGFWVERSVDARSFGRIAYEPSQGDSESAQHYEWIDHRALSLGVGNPIYYRLSQVDLDGHITQSEIRSVTFDQAGLRYVSVYPSQVEKGESLTVEMILPEDTQTTLALHNARGQLISQKTLEVPAKAIQTLGFDIPATPAGLYTLTVTGPDEVFSSTRIKLQ